VCKCTVILQVYNGSKISTVVQGTEVVQEKYRTSCVQE